MNATPDRQPRREPAYCGIHPEVVTIAIGETTGRCPRCDEAGTWSCDDCGWAWPTIAGEPTADAECDQCGSSNLTVEDDEPAP